MAGYRLGKDTYQRTLEDLEYFRKRVLHYMEVFGLRNWEASFGFDPDNEGYNAQVRMYSPEREAHFYLGRETRFCDMSQQGVGLFIREDIDQSAFHEACHVFLSDFSMAFEYREEKMKEHLEGIIRVLENILWPFIKDRENE